MTAAEFKNRFPEFDSIADSRIELLIDDADCFFDVCAWGGFYVQGLANMVAHNLSLSIQRESAASAGGTSFGASNNVTTKKVGDVQVTRDAGLLAAEAANPFMKTSYGQTYLYLLGRLGLGMLAI